MMTSANERSRKMLIREFLACTEASSVTLMTSASPLGFEVKYITFEPGVPCVRSYSRSRVMPVMLKRLI